MANCNCREMKFPGLSVQSVALWAPCLLSLRTPTGTPWVDDVITWLSRSRGRDDNNNIIPLHCCLLPVGNISGRAGVWSSGAWLIMKYSWHWTPGWSGISLSVCVVLVKGVSHQCIYGTLSQRVRPVLLSLSLLWKLQTCFNQNVKNMILVDRIYFLYPYLGGYI